MQCDGVICTCSVPTFKMQGVLTRLQTGQGKEFVCFVSACLIQKNASLFVKKKSPGHTSWIKIKPASAQIVK